MLGPHPDFETFSAGEAHEALAKLNTRSSPGGSDGIHHSMLRDILVDMVGAIASALSAKCRRPWRGHEMPDSILLVIPKNPSLLRIPISPRLPHPCPLEAHGLSSPAKKRARLANNLGGTIGFRCRHQAAETHAALQMAVAPWGGRVVTLGRGHSEGSTTKSSRFCRGRILVDRRNPGPRYVAWHG